MRRFLPCLALCLLVGSDRVSPVCLTAAPARVFVSPDAKLPTMAEFRKLAEANNPVACLKASVGRYRRDVQLLHAKLYKEERIGRRLNPVETIDVWYRTDPHSVMMKWESRPIGRAQQLIYVEGANDNKMLVKPKGLLAVAGVVPTDPDGAEAKGASRQNIRKSGPLKAAEEALNKWAAAEERNELHAEYLGIRTIEQAGNRKCHVFRRTVAKPGDDGVALAEIALDEESWIQVASIIKDANGELLGSYYFKVIDVNPQMPEALFSKSSLQ